MKFKLLIILSLTINFTCYAQSEPETVRGKDMLDKIDRSDIQGNDLDEPIGIDTSLPEIEFKKIEFDKPKVNKPVEKKSVQPVVQEKPVKEEDNTTKESSQKKKVLISNRSLSLSNLLEDDIVVNNDVTTYIYRRVKSNTVQFIYKGKMPFTSKGLKNISDNRYMIVDLEVLKSDSMQAKSTVKVKEPVKEATKPAEPVSENKSIPEPKKVTPKSASLSKTDKIKREFENEFTRGDKITETMELSDLLKNDIIHVSGDVQLVVRRNRNTYEMEYFWLIEKLDINKKSLINTPFRALSNNRYKVIKEYESSK